MVYLHVHGMQLGSQYVDRSEVERITADIQVQVQSEFNAKMAEVRAHLNEQARARDRLEELRDGNEQTLRNELERVRKEHEVSS